MSHIHVITSIGGARVVSHVHVITSIGGARAVSHIHVVISKHHYLNLLLFFLHTELYGELLL